MVFVAGAAFQNGRDSSDIAGKEKELARLTSELQGANQRKDSALADATAQRSELVQRIDALQINLEALQSEKERLTGEDVFLNRYIAYINGPNDINNKPLVEIVCSLWKYSDKRRVKFERQPLTLAPADLAQGRITPELQTLLVQNFVPLEPILQFRLADAGVAAAASAANSRKSLAHEISSNSSALQALGPFLKQISDIKLLKFVKFSDGARYEIPQATAVAVQIKRECAPY